MESTNLENQFKNVDILSFDGGGSRGILEVAILSDVMRLATILLKSPEDLHFLLGLNDISKDKNLREQLINAIKKVTNPIHPNDIYDMIVGTSTGALIAFGLVGGKCGENGKRLPMTLDECIQMYEEKTKQIFTMTWKQWFISKLPDVFGVPLLPYSKEKLEAVLYEQFKDSMLADFDDITPVAGAVARQIGQVDRLQLFHTRSDNHKYCKTHQVLQATTDAPVYFDTPVKIGDKEFVDGGVGGNCPLAQGISHATDIFREEVKIKTALSIAPPTPKESVVPTNLQIKYWLRYFAELSTDGIAVYLDAKERHKEIAFRRLSPRGIRLKDFKMDEIDTEKMLKALDKEKMENSLFLVDLIAIATFVVDTYLRRSQKSDEKIINTAAKMAQKAAEIYLAEGEHESSFDAYNVAFSLRKKSVNQNGKANSLWKIKEKKARCLERLGQIGRARNLYDECVKAYGMKNDIYMEVWSLNNLARCCIYTFRFEEAKTHLHLALEKQQMMALENPQTMAQEKRQMITCDKSDKQFADLQSNLSWCYRELGDYDEAVKWALKAQKLYEKLGFYPDNNVVDAATEQESPEKQETRKKKKKVPTSAAGPIISLALTYSKLGNHEEAVEKAEEALNFKKSIGIHEEDVSMAASFDHKAQCLIEKGDEKEALDYLKKALEIKKRYYGHKAHPSVAQTLSNMAKALLAESKNHLPTSNPRAFIAKLFTLRRRQNDKLSSPLEYAQQALEMMKISVGYDKNADFSDIVWVVGLCLESDGKHEDAGKQFKLALDMTEKIRGREHPTYIKRSSKLSDVTP